LFWRWAEVFSLRSQINRKHIYFTFKRYRRIDLVLIVCFFFRQVSRSYGPKRYYFQDTPPVKVAWLSVFLFLADISDDLWPQNRDVPANCFLSFELWSAKTTIAALTSDQNWFFKYLINRVINCYVHLNTI